jgi:hypothetical protein
MNEPLDFRFHQAADGNACPAANNFGDIVLTDFFLQ